LEIDRQRERETEDAGDEDHERKAAGNRSLGIERANLEEANPKRGATSGAGNTKPGRTRPRMEQGLEAELARRGNVP
jgi:hypothetical protein